MSVKKKAIVSVSSDLSTDQRVQKVCNTLVNNGFNVKLIGRQLQSSSPFTSKAYSVKRFSLWFNKGFLFYANLNLRLFISLLFSKASIFYANDLDTLPSNYLASRLRSKPLIYDSHEYFTEVPELINRPRVQNIWRRIERHIIPRLKYCITVTNKIAEEYNDQYGVDFKVMRNFPVLRDLQLDEKENYILYQGALNIGRGLEELIRAMQQVESTLWIAGTGDIHRQLQQLVEQLNLTKKVIFLGRLLPDELRKYTLKAKLGVSIEHKTGLNYTYALPNKIFDYIHAQTPVLYSELVEVKKVLNGTEIGQELKSYEPDELSTQLNQMLQSEYYDNWQKSCIKLKEQLNWQEEEKVLLSIVDSLE